MKIREPANDDDRVYTCARPGCEILRSKSGKKL